MEEFEQETKESPKKTKLLRRATGTRKLGLCFGFMSLVAIVTVALTIYLVYKVQRLSAAEVEDTPSAEPSTAALVAGIGDDENPLTETQKFFLNIGIRHDHLIQDCHETQLKKSFPNIDYAFLGYDIYRGYPLAEAHDPGFTHPIFRADYSEKRQSADCRFSIPNGVTVISDVSCVTSFSSNVIETEQDLANELSVAAEMSGGYLGASFSASSGYKTTASSLSSGNFVYVISSAHCDYYFAKIRKTLPPTFDEEFLIWLSRLDKTDSNVTYVEFMDTFGTHFLTGATFGARFTYEHKMTSKYFKATQSSGFSAAVRASYSGSFSIGGGFSLDSEQREAASVFSKNVQTRTITVGAAPPSNGDPMTWASTVQNNPIPVKYTLEPIENLFVYEYVGTFGIDYETIRLNILRYKEDYKKFRENADYADHPAEDLQEESTDSNIWDYEKKMLVVYNGGNEGDWGPTQYCPRGMYAIGYNLKIQPDQGAWYDDTGLNAVKLVCAKENGEVSGHTITSTEGHQGSYSTSDKLCPKSGTQATFLTRFSLQMHDRSSIAASFLKFECQDLDKTTDEVELAIYPGHGGSFGTEWYTSSSCPVGTAICGIKTKVEEDGGVFIDDSALNDVKFFCCGF